MGDSSYCCSQPISISSVLVLTTPSTFWTLLEARNRSNYSAIQEALRTDFQMLIACYTDILSIQVTDACYRATGRTFNCMILTELIATTVTANLRLFMTKCTSSRHLHRPKTCVNTHQISLVLKWAVLPKPYQSS